MPFPPNWPTTDIKDTYIQDEPGHVNAHNQIGTRLNIFRQAIGFLKEIADTLGQPNGIAQLDQNGVVLSNQLPSGIAVGPATTTIRGLVKLAGDFGGSADSPTVPTKVTRYTAVPTKIGAYVAGPYELIPADTAAGAFTITLQFNPADGTRIAIRYNSVNVTNKLTVVTNAGDVFDRTNGFTQRTLERPGQLHEYVYDLSTRSWITYEHNSFTDLKAFLDAGYANITNFVNKTVDYVGDDIRLNVPLFINGVEGPSQALTIGEIELELDIPSDLSVTSTTYRIYEGTGASRTQIGTDIVIPGGQITGKLGVSWTWQPTSRMYVSAVAQTGGDATSYLGAGLKVKVSVGAASSLPNKTVPGQPTISASAGALMNVLTLSLPSSAQSALIFRDGRPWREVAGVTTVNDAPLPVGETHSYTVAARGLGVMSAISAASAATPLATSITYAVFGGVDSTVAVQNMQSLLAATANGQAVATKTGTTAYPNLKYAQLTSGSLTGGNASDRVGVQLNAATTSHSLWDARALVAWGKATSVMQVLLAANDQALGPFTLNSGIQIEMSTTQLRVAYKAPSYTPTAAEGTQSAGQLAVVFPYTNFTSLAGATVPTADGDHWYPMRWRVFDSGGGVLKVEVWQGPAVDMTSLAGFPASPVWSIIASVTLDNLKKAALVPGRFAIVQLGKQGAVTTADSQTSRWAFGSVSPMSAAGV
jgi:hypothetical protein